MANFQTFWSFIKPAFIKPDNADPNTLKAGHTPQASQSAITDPPKDSVLNKLRRYYQYRVELEMKNWRIAVALAEDLIRPRRYDLYRLYHSAMEDDHLLSQVRTARFTVQMAEFSIMVGNSENEDLTDLLNRPWFDVYIRHCVDAELYGHSLVELTMNKAGEVGNVYLVPREHVRPETGEIVLDIRAETGIPYREGVLAKNLIEIGERDDLGLLKVAARGIIRKDYAIGDWSRRNEKYGMPFLSIKTMSRNETEINAKADMAANLGTNGWAILDDQDELEFHESNQPFAYQTFSDYADKVDEKISQLINGQTGTSDEKSFVGSAEVHERILNVYTKARMRRIQYHINYVLLPWLRTRAGYTIPQDAYFEYHDLRKSSDKATSMDNGTEQDPPPDQDPPPPPPKNKPPNKPNNQLHLIYSSTSCADHDHPNDAPTLQLNLDIDLNTIVDRAAKRVYEQRLKAGDVDADNWLATVTSLWNAVSTGTGIPIEYAYENQASYELISQLRRNVAVFATFKNHSHITELVQALVDNETGQLRSWSEFRAAVEPITKDYFSNWLQAEYQTAIGTGQMAQKWTEFQANADILPMLQYTTQRDDRVRDAHRSLDGVTLPINDPFWDTYYPPNGWRCRCDVIQVAGPENAPFLIPTEEEVPPVFRHNPGKTLELFPQSHPYYKSVPNETQKKNLIQATAELLYSSYSPEDWTKLNQYAKAGYVVAHKLADTARLPFNKLTAQHLAESHGEAIEILPANTADLSRDGILWATATPTTADIAAAAQKSTNVLVVLGQLNDEAKTLITQAKADSPAIKNLQVLETSSNSITNI